METPLVWFAVWPAAAMRFDATTLFLGQSRNRVKRCERARAGAADPRRALRRGEDRFFPLAARKTVDTLYNRDAATFIFRASPLSTRSVSSAA